MVTYSTHRIKGNLILNHLNISSSHEDSAHLSILHICPEETNRFNQKMGRPGFEPGTNRLKAEYSTVELATPAIAILRIGQHSYLH